jgi:hypothetical protein
VGFVSPAAETTRSAALRTGPAVGVAVFLWWTILRVRLEVGPGRIVTINPWGPTAFSWMR